MNELKKKLVLLRRRILFFWLWPMAFNFFAKKPINEKLILFAYNQNYDTLPDNMVGIYDFLKDKGYDCRIMNSPKSSLKRFLFGISFQKYYAQCKCVFLTDNFDPLYAHQPQKGTKVIQLWHACGAFKSLGFERLGKPGAPPFNTRVHKCYTHVPVSSYHSALHHAEGFAIDEKKFYPVGIPRTDIFFDDDYKAKTKAQMLEVFPECKTAKTVYMYAPTFRGDNANNAYFPFDKLDLTAWGKFLDETDSVLIVKLHPFVKRRIEIPDEYAHRILDASDYREVNDILFIVDVLITDYSSIIYEMSLLKKPMLFFAFDQKHYEATRDFYEPYEELVPGKIVHDFDELMTALKNKDYEFEKMEGFIKKNFKYTDGKSTDRVIDQLIMGIEPDDNSRR